MIGVLMLVSGGACVAPRSVLWQPVIEMSSGIRTPFSRRPGVAAAGWRGESPAYHVPVFVLTHHPRASTAMKGGTTFHFVTEGIHAALDRAAAAGKDVGVGGGVATIGHYLNAGLVDERHLALTLLGKGEALLAGIDLPALGFECTRRVAGLTMGAMNDATQAPPLPDRLSSDPRSPHHLPVVFERGIGIRFNDKERFDVEEYCISEGWIKVAAGKTLDRKGRPLLITLKGKVEAFYR